MLIIAITGVWALNKAEPLDSSKMDHLAVSGSLEDATDVEKCDDSETDDDDGSMLVRQILMRKMMIHPNFPLR